MAAEAPPTSTPQHAAGPSGPNHGLRIFLIWLPVAIAADLIIPAVCAVAPDSSPLLISRSRGWLTAVRA